MKIHRKNMNYYKQKLNFFELKEYLLYILNLTNIIYTIILYYIIPEYLYKYIII